MSQLRRPAGHVHVVELDHLVEGHVVAPRDLPETGDAGRDVEALLGPAAAAAGFVDPQRPRPDQAHLAAHHVEELGHFVEAPLAQHSAHARDARVALDLEHGSRILVQLGQVVAQLLGLGVHGAQLEDAERHAAAPHALLPEEHRPARVEFDGERKQADQRQGDGREHAAHQQVEDALDDGVEARHLDVGHVEQGDALDVVHGGLRAQDLEQARHDVHAHAAVGAGAHHVEDLLVASARESDDDPSYVVAVEHVVRGLRGAPRPAPAAGSRRRARRRLSSRPA